MGALITALVAAMTATGFALTATGRVPFWLLGQAVLAIALVQWFIVLHEAGHLTLFRSRALNHVLGHTAAFFALIPFAAWRRVHGLHHVWTGWQDKDPTTATLAPRARGKLTIGCADIAWRCWLPLFSIAYRLGNYWNVPRLWRLLPEAAQRRAVLGNVAAAAAGYWVLGQVVGAQRLLEHFAPAILISFALQDPLILSQHTHLPQKLSRGERVQPLSPEAQARHTRSLGFPRWFAQWVLFNFNAHELHHRFAAVPGYRLGELRAGAPNEVPWRTWLRAAKRLRGSVFVFQSRDETGFGL